jgi:peptidase M48-like protein
MDMGRRAPLSELCVLTYHRAVAERLEQDEPNGWATVGKLRETAPSGIAGWDDEPAPDPAAELLRSAYRLEPAGHPIVHAALARAAENLGLDTPVALYQVEGGLQANAGLVSLPDELAIVLSGNLISMLSEDGLSAVFGHELSHHLLWSLDEGRYQVADRLLELLSIESGTSPAQLETFRRYRLASELFADRGAVVACGDLLSAVGALVTAATGLADVDPASYLAQAQAVDPLAPNRAPSHPETVLRAWALGQWYAELGAEIGAVPVADRLPAGESAARALLRPRLDLDALDLFDRAELERVTRNLIEDLLLHPEWHSEPVLAHVRQFFPDLSPVPRTGNDSWGSPGFEVRSLPDALSAQTRRYLGYVLLDLITVDPDLDVEIALARALGFADELGMAADLDRLARAELELSAAAWTRIGAAAKSAVR